MQLQNQKLSQNPYHPFEYKEQFDLAYWLLATDQPISKKRIIAMIKLHSQDPYSIESRFNNYQHFTDAIDNIEYNLPWSSASLDVPPALKKENSGWNDSLTFHYRNALDCVRSLFGQTSLLGHMEYAPKRMFDAQGNVFIRIYRLPIGGGKFKQNCQAAQQFCLSSSVQTPPNFLYLVEMPKLGQCTFRLAISRNL